MGGWSREEIMIQYYSMVHVQIKGFTSLNLGLHTACQILDVPIMNFPILLTDGFKGGKINMPLSKTWLLYIIFTCR